MYKMFDRVLLKNGKVADIMEDSVKGIYIADIAQGDGEYETEVIRDDEIERLIKHLDIDINE